MTRPAGSAGAALRNAMTKAAHRSPASGCESNNFQAWPPTLCRRNGNTDFQKCTNRAIVFTQPKGFEQRIRLDIGTASVGGNVQETKLVTQSLLAPGRQVPKWAVLAKRASLSSPAQDAVHAMQTRPRGAGAAVDKLVSEVFFQNRELASRPVGRGGQPRAGKRRNTYTEIKRARRCRLIFLGIEVSGRWASRATTFVRLLARVRAAVGLATSRAAARVCGFWRWNCCMDELRKRRCASGARCNGTARTAGKKSAKNERLQQISCFFLCGKPCLHTRMSVVETRFRNPQASQPPGNHFPASAELEIS